MARFRARLTLPHTRHPPRIFFLYIFSPSTPRERPSVPGNGPPCAEEGGGGGDCGLATSGRSGIRGRVGSGVWHPAGSPGTLPSSPLPRRYHIPRPRIPEGVQPRDQSADMQMMAQRSSVAQPPSISGTGAAPRPERDHGDDMTVAMEHHGMMRDAGLEVAESRANDGGR